MTAPSTVDEYIASFPAETRAALAALRALVHEVAPAVTEKISHGMPTFLLDDRYLVYMGGWKQHVALYPLTDGVAEACGAELAPFRGGKGSVKFPLAQPLPMGLIRRFIELRVRENEALARRTDPGDTP